MVMRKENIFIMTVAAIAICLIWIVFLHFTNGQKNSDDSSVKQAAAVADGTDDTDSFKGGKDKAGYFNEQNNYFTSSGNKDLSSYLFRPEAYKTVCLRYSKDKCTLSGRLYKENSGSAVLYKICKNHSGNASDKCAKNLIASYNNKGKIDNLYSCDASAPFGQCGKLKMRKHYTYDKSGNISLEETFIPNKNTETLNSVYKFTYDSLGNPIYSQKCLSLEGENCTKWDLPAPHSYYPSFLFSSFSKDKIMADRHFIYKDKYIEFIFDREDHFIALLPKSYAQEAKPVVMKTNDKIIEQFCSSQKDDKCEIGGNLMMDKKGRAVSYSYCEYDKKGNCGQVQRTDRVYFDDDNRVSMLFSCDNTISADNCKTGTAIVFMYPDNPKAKQKDIIEKQIYCTSFNDKGKCLKYDTGWIKYRDKYKDLWLYCFAFDDNGECINPQGVKDSLKKMKLPDIVPPADRIFLNTLPNVEFSSDRTKAYFCKARQKTCVHTGEMLEFIKGEDGEVEVVVNTNENTLDKKPYARYVEDGSGNYIDIYYPNMPK